MQTQFYRPDHKMYAFDGGWKLTWHGARTIIGWANTNAAWWSKHINSLTDGASYEGVVVKFFYYIGVVFCVFMIIVLYCLATLALAMWVSAFVLILSPWAGFLLLLLGFVISCSWIYARYYRISYPCPHCYGVMVLPAFICPKCHKGHFRLWPSTYGIFSHPCHCKIKLPTLDNYGRKKLARICQSCHRALDDVIGQGPNINIPIVGGPSSGKTSYIVTATQAFKNTYEKEHGYAISFTNPVDRQNFESRIRQLSMGVQLAKTSEISPQAYNLEIKAPQTQIPTIVFIYDAAGEAFATDAEISLQTYYKYIHACIFIIDPCAIPAYRRTHYNDIECIRRALGPSSLDVTEVYDRMIRMLEIYRGLKRSGSYKLPAAVVVTKVDALGLQDEIGIPAVQRLMTNDWSYKTQEEASNALILDFLQKYGFANLLRDLEMHFSEIRYFSCSALGRLPLEENKAAFISTGVLDPLVWLFARTGVIKAE